MSVKTTYLSIEGCDGSGKTLLAHNLSSYLLKAGFRVFSTNEFRSVHSSLCVDLVRIALSSDYDIDEMSGQLLFAAIVRQHQQKVILPELNSEKWDYVISDRGIDTNFAYGLAHGLSLELLERIFEIAYAGSKLPDLTLYLDIEPEIAIGRISTRSLDTLRIRGKNRIETKGASFLERVRGNYLVMAKDIGRIKILDVREKEPEELLKESINILSTLGLI